MVVVMDNWEGKKGKYLNECGFHAFAFGYRVYNSSLVDIETSDDTVVAGVTKEQCADICAFLKRLEKRVQDHIDIHYTK
jgi:hypothetical protein